MNKIELIPFGKENRISKKELAKRLKMNCIEVNNVISELRTSYIILSDSTVGGFWRPNTEKELLDFIRECNSKCQAENDTIEIAWQELDELRGKR